MRTAPINSLVRPRLLAVAVGLALLIAGVTAAAALFNSRPALGAGGGGSGCLSTSPSCTFRSHNASADFTTASSDGCTFSDAFAQPFESLSVPGKGSMRAVFVGIFAFNVCTQTELYSFSNVDPSTGIPVFSGTMQFGTPDLTSAAVSGTATMFDNATGTFAFVSTVSVSWQGYGPISSFINGFHFRAPGFLFNGHDVGHSRGAAAQGTITDASGNNLASVPTPNGSLENDVSGNVQVSRS